VLCVPPGVAALDAVACGRGRVCNAAPPLRVPAAVTCTLSVQCGGVAATLCVWVSLCRLLFDFREWQCAQAVVSVHCCAAVLLSSVLLSCCVAMLLCCCDAVCDTALLGGHCGCQQQ
jgi:hypothetical protein